MSDDAALMAAIHDLPHDDLPRLAYADWQEEHGRPLRAEFIRVELELERPGVPADRLRGLRRREIDLILAHKDEWFGTFRAGWSHYDCRRGFIEEVTSSADAFLPHARWLFDNHAVQRVSLSGGADQLRRWLGHPLLGVLACARYSGQGMGRYSACPAPVPAPLASRPLSLQVTTGAGADLIDALVRSPYLARLGQLDLSGNRLWADGVADLLDRLAGWPMLTCLNLSGVGEREPTTTADNIGSVGIERLARHPAAAQLRVLDLGGNLLTERAVRALVDSPYLGGIERLTVGPIPGRQRTWVALLRGRFGDRVRCGPETQAASS